MNGQLVNEYSKLCSDGKRRTMYVYKVTGTKAEVEEFLDSDSAKTVDGDSGDNLLITTRYGGERVKLVITKDNRVTFDQSEMRKVASLAQQFGEAGKGILTDYINGQLRGTSVANTTKKAEAEPVKDELDLDNL